MVKINLTSVNDYQYALLFCLFSTACFYIRDDCSVFFSDTLSNIVLAFDTFNEGVN